MTVPDQSQPEIPQQQPMQNTEIDIECTELQHKAIVHDFTTPGSLLNIVAGPGSGKTRTLSNRIAYMISQGLKPDEILVLSLTNRAVGDIQVKLKSVVGDDLGSQVDILTFHSFASSVLDYCYDKDWYLLEDDQLKKLYDLISHEMKSNRKPYSSNVFKNLIKAVRAFDGNMENYEQSKLYITHKLPKSLYKKITYLVGSNHAFTYEDLLIECHEILRSRNPPDFTQNYKVVIVDEIQDIYPALSEIILDLSASKHLTIAGDPNQSIFKFLGAEYSKNWGKILPQFKHETISLNKSFRSTPELLEFSSKILGTRLTNMDSCVKGASFLQPVRMSFTSEFEEFDFIYNEIERIRKASKNTIKYSDIAILSFTNNDVDSCYRYFETKEGEMGLNRLSATPKWLNTDISLILQYMKILIDPNQSLALLTTLSMLKGVGMSTMNTIHNSASEKGIPVWEYINNHDMKKSRVMGIIDEYIEFINECRSNTDLNDPNSIMHAIVTLANKYGLKKRLFQKRLSPLQLHEYEDFILSIWNSLRSMSKVKPEDITLLQFYLHNYNTELMMSPKLKQMGNIEDYDSKVNFSTIHTAKGLEFPIVFILSQNNNNLFLSEKKKVMYVAVTRATTLLYFNKLNNHYVASIDDHVLKSKPNKSLKAIDAAVLEKVQKGKFVITDKPPNFNRPGNLVNMLGSMGKNVTELHMANHIRGLATLVSRVRKMH